MQERVRTGEATVIIMNIVVVCHRMSRKGRRDRRSPTPGGQSWVTLGTIDRSSRAAVD
jgi:hypothetical protein